jgi:phosphatidylglycerol:prolipoprotein diacylglycerol transferase
VIQVPAAPWAHLVCDLAAWSRGIGARVALCRWRLGEATQALATRVDGGYFVALGIGAALGAWIAGSLNSLRQSAPALSHSVAGALVGAIVAVQA